MRTNQVKASFSVRKAHKTQLAMSKRIIFARAVTTMRGRRQLYISAGHMVSLEKAIEIVRHCASSSLVPEPILKAHEIANTEKRKINNDSGTKSWSSNTQSA